VHNLHVTKLSGDFCPFRGCLNPNVTAEKLVAHVNGLHRLPMREPDLRPSPRPTSLVPAAAPMIPDQIIPTYLLSTEPVIPYRGSKMESAVGMRRSRSGNSVDGVKGHPRQAKILDTIPTPICPNRQVDCFWPVNGEAYIESSSSIFPPVAPHRRDEREARLDAIQSNAAGRQVTEFLLRPRPEKPRRPNLFPGTIPFARWKVQEKRKEMEISRKRKDPDRTDEVTATESSDISKLDKGKWRASDEERFAVEKILRASKRRATRVTGKSIGIGHVEETLAFERRGIELGELTKDQLEE